MHVVERHCRRGRRSEHQASRGADRPGRRDDPHVGAAPRRARARAQRVGLPPLLAGRRRPPAPRAGLPPPRAVGRRPRSSAPARTAATATTRRSTPRSRRTDHGARPQVLRKSTLVALSRAIEHETLAHAARPMLFGAFQHEEFYREVEPRYRRIAAPVRRRLRVRRLRRGSGTRRAARSRSPSARRTPWATSGASSSTRPATRPACWPGSSRGSPSPAAPATPTGASSRSGRSTRAPPGAPRRSPRGSPPARTPSTASA